MSPQYDCLVKLLMIGDSGVGKSCILLRYTENSFTSFHLSTIGIDFKLKNIEVDSKKIKLHIWDTAGQERFQTLTKNYYKGAMGIILAYDCTRPASFENIKNWVYQIKSNAQEGVSLILLGNKCDSLDKKVQYHEGAELAGQLGIKFLETSAKENLNVTEAFDGITRDVLSNWKPEKQNIKLNSDGSPTITCCYR